MTSFRKQAGYYLKLSKWNCLNMRQTNKESRIVKAVKQHSEGVFGSSSINRVITESIQQATLS